MPDVAELSVHWRDILAEAARLVYALPVEHVGCCVTDRHGNLIRASAAELATLLQTDMVRFHIGCLRGAWPRILG